MDRPAGPWTVLGPPGDRPHRGPVHGGFSGPGMAPVRGASLFARRDSVVWRWAPWPAQSENGCKRFWLGHGCPSTINSPIKYSGETQDPHKAIAKLLRRKPFRQFPEIKSPV